MADFERIGRGAQADQYADVTDKAAGGFFIPPEIMERLKEGANAEPQPCLTVKFYETSADDLWEVHLVNTVGNVVARVCATRFDLAWAMIAEAVKMQLPKEEDD